MDASAKLLAIVALAAFITERSLAAASYLLDTFRYLRVRREAPKLHAKARRRFVLTVLASVIAYAVVDRADVRLLRLMEVGHVHPLVDFWLTWLVVFAGADRVRGMLRPDGVAPAKKDVPALQVRVNGQVQELRRTA